MRASTISLVLAIAGVTLGQTTTTDSATPCFTGTPCAASIAAVPTCGLTCLQTAAQGIGCDVDDFVCQCASFGTLEVNAATCVVGACGADAITLLNAANAVCACISSSPTCTPVPSTTSTSSSSTTDSSTPTTTSAPTTTSTPEPTSSTTASTSSTPTTGSILPTTTSASSQSASSTPSGTSSSQSIFSSSGSISASSVPVSSPPVTQNSTVTPTIGTTTIGKNSTVAVTSPIVSTSPTFTPVSSAVRTFGHYADSLVALTFFVGLWLL